MDSPNRRATTDGWRGILAEGITGDFVRKVASSLAVRTSPGIFVIGYDTRFLSDYFAHEAAKTIAQYGHRCVLSQGPLPTPVLAWACRYYSADWGFQITASHNPPEYSGIKLRTRHGTPPAPEDLLILQEGGNATGEMTRGSIEYADLIELYCTDIKSVFELPLIARRFPRVVVDSMFGTTAGVLKRIAGSHFEVSGVRMGRDAWFGGETPEPRCDTLGPLSQALKQLNCPIGFAHDGDGDRIAGWELQTGYISPQDLLVILAWDLVARGVPGTFIVSATTTARIEQIAFKYHREIIQVDVGFHNASEHMIGGGIALAGEENGGVAFGNHIPDRDGTYAALAVLEALARHRMSIAEILYSVGKEFGPLSYIRRDVKIFNRSHFDFHPILTNVFSTKAIATTRLKSGAKVRFADGSWLVIRQAGTEPLVRVYAEACNYHQASSMVSSVIEALKNGDPSA